MFSFFLTKILINIIFFGMYLQKIDRKRRVYLASFVLAMWISYGILLLLPEIRTSFNTLSLSTLVIGILIGLLLNKLLIPVPPVLAGMILSSILFRSNNGIMIIQVITLTAILMEFFHFGLCVADNNYSGLKRIGLKKIVKPRRLSI
jgi:MFS family permease